MRIVQMEFQGQYRMEETFSNLLTKFDHIVSLNQDHLSNFNEIVDHIRINRNSNRQTLSHRKQQLQNLLKRDKQRDMSISQISFGESSHNETMSLKTMERSHFCQQLYELKSTICTLRQKKQEIQTQLQIFASKDQQTMNTLLCCQKDADELMILVAHQKKENKILDEKNEKDLVKLRIKKNQLSEEIKSISDQIDTFDQLVQIKRKKQKLQHTTKQCQEEVLPFLSKIQLEEALRSLCMILKFKKLWTASDQNQCPQLSMELASDLDPIEKIRFMNKTQICERYQKLGCRLGDQLIQNICQFYESLSAKFDRTERVHFQFTQTLAQLKKTEDELNASIQRIQQNKAKNTIKILQANDSDLNLLESKVCLNCKLIFNCNLAFHSIIKKLTSLNKTFSAITRQIKATKLFKKTYYDVNQGFTNQFQTLLERSPEQVLLKWNSRINIDNSQVDSQEGKRYLVSILKNDLLRVLATPEVYQHQQSALQNYNTTFDKVMADEQIIMRRLVSITTDLLGEPKQGIKSLEAKCVLRSMKTSRAVGPETFSESNRYCVESKQYFRRDNFKLLENLDRIELKRKGLYVRPPFEIGGQDQIFCQENAQMTPKNHIQMMLQNHKLKHSNSERIVHQKYGNLLTEKRSHRGNEEKSIRRILGQISHIASSNYKYRIKKENRDRAQRNTHQVQLDRSNDF